MLPRVGAGDDTSGEIKAVELDAELRQIKTMVDGSTNIIINVPEYCRQQVKVLLDWMQEEIRLVIAKA